MVNQVVPAAEHEPTVIALACSIATGALSGLTAAKQALRRGLDLPLEAAIECDATAALVQRAQAAAGSTSG